MTQSNNKKDLDVFVVKDLDVFFYINKKHNILVYVLNLVGSLKPPQVLVKPLCISYMSEQRFRYIRI